MALPATQLFPKETGVADAALIYDPSCENGFQESPQTFLKPEIKIIFPLNMRKAARSAFKIVCCLLQYFPPVKPGYRNPTVVVVK